MNGKHSKRTPRAGVDLYGRTPLHVAVIDGSANLVAGLLRSAAMPNAQDDSNTNEA
jgi:ankyrin repeat protein